MALIKTIQEIRAVIPRVGALSNTANLPNVDKAGRMHIIPIIGSALYKDLNTKYNAEVDSRTDLEKELIKHIQLPLAAYALLDDLAFIHTVITDNGIRTNTSSNMEAAHRWEYKELENALANYAADGIEILLGFLYENKDDLSLWTNSDEYKEIDRFLIRSGQDFSKYYSISQPNRTFWNLKPTMDMVEENYLASSLGYQILSWVKSQPDITINVTGGQVDVKKLLKKAVANLTIKHAGETLAVRFGADGFTILSGGSADSPTSDGKTAASARDLQTKIDAANREGQNFLTTAIKYLQQIGEGDHGETLKASIAAAYSVAPIKKDPEASPVTKGNERRKIYVF